MAKHVPVMREGGLARARHSVEANTTAPRSRKAVNEWAQRLAGVEPIEAVVQTEGGRLPSAFLTHGT